MLFYICFQADHVTLGNLLAYLNHFFYFLFLPPTLPTKSIIFQIHGLRSLNCKYAIICKWFQGWLPGIEITNWHLLTMGRCFYPVLSTPQFPAFDFLGMRHYEFSPFHVHTSIGVALATWLLNMFVFVDLLSVSPPSFLYPSVFTTPSVPTLQSCCTWSITSALPPMSSPVVPFLVYSFHTHRPHIKS